MKGKKSETWNLFPKFQLFTQLCMKQEAARMEQQGTAVDVILWCGKAELWTLTEGQKGPSLTHPAIPFPFSGQEVVENSLAFVISKLQLDSPRFYRFPYTERLCQGGDTGTFRISQALWESSHVEPLLPLWLHRQPRDPVRGSSVHSWWTLVVHQKQIVQRRAHKRAINKI